MALTQVSSDGIKNLNVKTADLENSGVTAGTYGSASLIPALVIDAKGRVTSASTNAISTDLVNDTSPQLGGDLASNGNNINIADNDSIKIGTGNDLDIFHDGTDSKVDIDNGQLLIRNASNAQILAIQQDKDIFTDGHVHFADNVEARFGAGSDLRIFHANGNANFIQSYNDVDLRIHTFGTTAKIRLQVNESENAVVCIPNDSVELHFNGTRKAYTSSDGFRLDDNLRLDDSKQIRLGNSEDLKIYHDGTTNIIEGLNGNMSIRPKTGENGILIRNNGAVELYYDDVKKFETESTGVRVHGRLQFPDETGSNEVLSMGDGQDFELFHNGSNNIIYGRNNHDTLFYTNGSNRMVLQNNGHLRPSANNTFDLGTSSIRWRNIYTNDLNLSNEGSSNDVDGTWGSFTIQEGAESLFLINRRNGKKYKFNLTEVS